MQPSLMRDTAAYTKRHRKAKLGKRILAVLIALVIGFTAYAMIFPAITQSNQTACSMAEHIHDSACYENERVVICRQEESAEHTHEDACYDLEPVLTCPLVEHIHDETCAADATPTDPMADLGIGTIADEVYWQKVSSIDDTSASYLILPSSSSVALAVRRSGSAYSATAVSVTLTELTETPGYYTAAGVTDACKWSFTQSGAGYVIKNSSYTTYGLNLSGSSYISTSTTTNTLAYTESSETFTIGYNNYYLIYRNSSFSRSRSYSNYRPMVIYKEVSSLPDSGGNTESGDSTTDPNVKPEYPAYVEVSSEKTGTTVLGGIAGTYDSDPATSQLESLFQGVESDDGRIQSDKSVLYGDDDYDVFSSYDPNTFGVTLSALGQKYSLTEEFGIKMPLDVVFVLDASGSMINGRTTDGKSCAAAMIEALNETMAEIYSLNENNRVGVVCYSGQGHTLLELGRYTAPDNLFFPENSYTSNTDTLAPSKSIASLDGGTFEGTVTYTENGQNVTLPYSVRRHPVMILLSDGDPTYATSEYNNVLNASKIYGNGQAGNTTNNQGVNGYYTILSAKYYKDQVSAHYDANTSFYTIGLGTSETATSDSSGQSVTGDHYKRAVLNPSDENITALAQTYSDDTNRTVTSQQLYKLLHNTYTGSTITLGSDTSTYNQYGLPHATSSTIPVIDNPYVTGGYAYADGAYFSEKMTAAQLAAEFKEKIQLAVNIPVYGLVLKANTTVCLTDSIGEGMELKSMPILRYAGENHQPASSKQEGNSVIYSYSGTYTATDGSGQEIDLSQVTVTVTTEDGLQTVIWNIPDEALPSYTPRISASGEILYYYEALPIRCIYQLGLTEAAENKVQNLTAAGGECVFYTNRWDETSVALTDIVPTDGNPYYADGTYDTATLEKTVNQTQTAAYSLSYPDSADSVQQRLGNNGKLTFRVSDLTVTVAKEWDSSVLPQDYHTVTAYLYLVKDEDGSVLPDSTLTVTLQAQTDWQATIAVPVPPDGYHYYIGEQESQGYHAAYKQGSEILLTDTITVNGETVEAAKIETLTGGLALTVENFKYATLPATGGRGILPWMLAGSLLMALAVGRLFGKRPRGLDKNVLN